jgi:hypothetical protein
VRKAAARISSWDPPLIPTQQWAFSGQSFRFGIRFPCGVQADVQQKTPHFHLLFSRRNIPQQ